MQTKSVLTALSLSILCSTTAFGMMPRLAAAAMRQAGRTTFGSGMRQLPGKGAPRRFLSDTPSSSNTHPTTNRTFDRIFAGIAGGSIGAAAAWKMYGVHSFNVPQEHQQKHDKKKAEEEEKERTQEVVEIVMRKQLSQKTIKEIESKVAATKNPFWPEYKEERYRLLCESYIKQFRNPEDEPEARHAQFHGFASRKTT